MVCGAESMTIEDEESVVVMHEAKTSQTRPTVPWPIHVFFDTYTHHAEM